METISLFFSSLTWLQWLWIVMTLMLSAAVGALLYLLLKILGTVVEVLNSIFGR